jgi:hypothetical protein
MTEMTLYTPHAPALATKTTDELRAALATSLTLTAQHLVHLSAIWTELESRGEDLSELRTGISVYLPLIARGDLNAQLVIKYAGQTMLLRHMAELPKEDQDRLVIDDTVTVVDYRDGEFIETSMAASKIDARLLSQVFQKGILNSEKQHEIARRRVMRKQKGKDRQKQSALSVAAEMQSNVRSIKKVPIIFHMTHADREHLKKRATEEGVPLTQLIRAALIQAGYIK